MSSPPRTPLLFIHALAVACALGFGANALAQPMSVADYLAAKRQLSSERQVARSACGNQTANRLEVCLADAEGKDWVAKADLDVAYRSAPRSRADASLARADARYWMARERCDDVASQAKPACLVQATTERASARDKIAAQRKREEHDTACTGNNAACTPVTAVR